jgi:hypothetical protein
MLDELWQVYQACLVSIEIKWLFKAVLSYYLQTFFLSF